MSAADNARALDFARRILALKDAYPFTVTSWGRTAARNIAVGGRADSRHLDWCAIDAQTDAVAAYYALKPSEREHHPQLKFDAHTTSAELARIAREHGLVAVDEGDHVHIHAPREAV